MGSKGSQKTTQSYTPNAAVGQTGTQALDMARYAAAQPFQQPAAPVADFSEDQLSAFANFRRDQNLAQPYMNRASGYFDESAQPITAAQIGNYLNPFASYIMGGLQDIFGQQRVDTTGRLTQAAGGIGADRIGIAQANLAKQQGLAAGQTLAGIYQPALAAAQQDAARKQSAAYGLGQLGTAAQNAALQGTQALLGGGNQQQALAQAKLMSPYQQRLAELEYPFKTAQFLSGINAQQAQPLGGTTTNTYPGQSPWGTIAGLGLTAAGAFTGNPAMMKGGMSALGASQMGGASQGPLGFGGYQPGMSAGSGFQWQPSPHGLGAMAPMAYGAGGSVEFQDAFRPYQMGGNIVDLEDIGGSYQEGGGVDLEHSYWPPMPTTVGNAEGIDWNAQPPPVSPDVATALETGAPLPESVALPPTPAPITTRPNLPPEITGGNDIGIPPSAMGYAAAPRGMPALPPPMAQPAQANPYTLPADTGEGTFARSPGLALMNAGLATMAAAGRRDSRGLPLSPWAAIGEGGMKGIETLKVQDQLGTQRRRVDLEARRLLQQAEHQRSTLAETKRYHDILDQGRRDQREMQDRLRQLQLDPSRLSPVQQALIAATRRKGSPLDDNEVVDIIQRTQREPAQRTLTPEQQVLQRAEQAKGSPLTPEEMTDILTKLRQGSRAPTRPLTPEQQAIAARERSLGRPLDETEIAQVVQTVRQGPPPAAGETPPSTILGEDDIAPNFEGATGLSGMGTNLWNKVTGAFGAQAYPAEHKATRILGDLAVKTQSTLQNVAGRPSNYWLGRLETLTVKPNSWSEGPQAARDRLIQTRDTIDQEIKRVDAIVQNPQTTKGDRSKAIRSQGELRGLRADYDAVIGAWGGGAGNPLSPIGETIPVPSMGEVREGVGNATGITEPRPPARPKNAPAGSRLQSKGTGKDKKYRWVDSQGRPIEP